MTAVGSFYTAGNSRPAQWPAPAHLRPRHARLVGLSLLAALLAFAMVADRLLQPDAYPVKQVSFEGEFHYVTPEQLRRVVGEQAVGSYFALDLSKLEAAARSIPWVDQVSIRREWPQSLHVRYTEHRLVAHWDDGRWLSASGALLNLPGHEALERLPGLAGPEGTHTKVLARYRQYRELLDAVGLELNGLELGPRYSWVARVSAGDGVSFSLLLGKIEAGARLRRFLHSYVAVLAPSAARIRYVDLRYPNGFAVGWHGNTAAAAHHSEGES
jgi:cell division protein FtsQ